MSGLTFSVMSFKGISNVSLDVSRKCLYTSKCKNMHQMIDWIKNHDWDFFFRLLRLIQCISKSLYIKRCVIKSRLQDTGRSRQMMQSDRGKLLNQGVQGKLKVENSQNKRYFFPAGPSSLEAKKLTTDFHFCLLSSKSRLISSSVADHVLWHPISLLPPFSGSHESSLPNCLPLSLYARPQFQEASIGNWETTSNQQSR